MQSVTQTITATLQGSSTLTEDLRVNISILNPDGAVRRSTGGNLLGGWLELPAGETAVDTSIELTNLDDSIDDDDEVLELRGSTTNPDITVTPDTLTITNDDTAALKLSPTGGMVFSEIGGRYYSVKLGSEPTSDVTVTIQIPADAKFTISADTLTFTPDDWNQEQLVRVDAVADPDRDTELSQIITHTIDSSDNDYRSLPSVEYPITVFDTVGGRIDVTGSPLTVDEGSTGTYTVALNIQPTADVTVAITGMTGTDVSVDDAELTFTDQNWDEPQTVTVTAAQDSDTVNDSVTLTHTATGGGYDGVAAVDVPVTVVDDGVLAVTVEFGSAHTAWRRATTRPRPGPRRTRSR